MLNLKNIILFKQFFLGGHRWLINKELGRDEMRSLRGHSDLKDFFFLPSNLLASNLWVQIFKKIKIKCRAFFNVFYAFKIYNLKSNDVYKKQVKWDMKFSI